MFLWKCQGCKGCQKDNRDGYTDNKDTHGWDTEELWISLTDKICKAFTEKSSSLIFPWHPHGHMASMVEATRTSRMLRMAVWTLMMIRKSLNIFHIRNPAVIRRYIRLCVTGVLLFHNYFWDFTKLKINVILNKSIVILIRLIFLVKTIFKES